MEANHSKFKVNSPSSSISKVYDLFNVTSSHHQKTVMCISTTLIGIHESGETIVHQMECTNVDDGD